MRWVRSVFIATAVCMSLGEILAPAGGPTVAAGAQPCVATRPDVMGPYYKPNAPVRSSVGSGYVLTGTVRSAADCAPIAGARIEFWLTRPDGVYTDDHRATVLSGARGEYRFESTFPAPYPGASPHIHIRVSARGFRTVATRYFPTTRRTSGTLDLVLIRVR
jgi:protocatechuate 3,4-dioxygenase beta subunit